LVATTLELFVECLSRADLNDVMDDINGQKIFEDVSVTFKGHQKIQHLLTCCRQQFEKPTQQKLIRTFTFLHEKTGPLHVQLRLEENRNVGVASKVWEAALILGRWIHQHSYLFESQHVLEVGSGCGLSRLVAAHYAKRTVLSDCLSQIVRNLEYSISLKPQIVTKTIATVLDWNLVDSAPHSAPQLYGQPFDVIVASEVLYQPKLSMALATVIKHYLKYGGTFYCVSMEERFRLGIKPFVEKLKLFNFELAIEKVPKRFFEDFSDECHWIFITGKQNKC